MVKSLKVENVALVLEAGFWELVCWGLFFLDLMTTATGLHVVAAFVRTWVIEAKVLGMDSHGFTTAATGMGSLCFGWGYM